MVLFLIIQVFVFIIKGLIFAIPSFETPVWMATQLTDVLTRVASFNYYLPVYETVGISIFLVNFVIIYKIAKIVLNIVRIDLNQ